MNTNFKKFQRKITLFIVSIEKEVVSIWHEARRVLSRLRYIIKRKSSGNLIKNALVLILALGFMVFGAGLLWFSTIEIPDLASFDKRVLAQSTKIFDKTGKVLLYDLSQNMRRTSVDFDKISPNIKKATLAIEDVEFYSHSGIKITSIVRAFLVDLFSLKFNQGGSTITQQVVKNTLLTKKKSISRKIKEMLLAIKLEKNLSKDEIFNLYLNESPYGGTIYGVEEASQSFFGKSASDLTIAEGAYLAAIPQAPTYYSPYGKNRDQLDARKNLVLLKMKENKFLTDEEYEEAMEEKVKFQDQVSRGIKAPHFVMFIKQYLEEAYGEKLLAEGGLKVITTLDYELQQKAEEIVLKYALDNAKLHNAKNSSLVAVDSKTGGILVMVGSRDYFDKEIEGNFNIATAQRQPGSSFKPFIYAEAFNKGYRPETVLFDLPTQFSTNCEPDDMTDAPVCYAPENYDGKWRGPITLRSALAQSINLPAVKMLYLVGIQDGIDLAKQMGITTLTSTDRYGLSLVLGGGEVTLLDMTGAYSVFATGGIKNETHGILKIEDKNGKILEEEKIDEGSQVLPKDTALLISDILSDNVARTPMFGANSSLYFKDRDVAAKTGTTNNYRDTWILGYTPQVAVGAWTGNNDNSPIDRKVAGTIVAPMWHAFMEELLKTLPDEKFEEPEEKDLSKLKPVLRGEWQGNNPSDVHSILYYVDKDNPLGGAPKNPWNDPQLAQWEYPIQKWLAGQGINTGTLDGSETNNNQPNNSLFVNFLSPVPDQIYPKNSQINSSIKTLSDYPITKADYFVNGNYIGSNSNSPFGFSFIPGEVSNIKENNILRVVITDSKGFTKETSITFQVK